MGLVPLHGYFDGDFLGLVVFAFGEQKIAEVSEGLASWVLDLRVERTGGELELVYHGQTIDPNLTMEESGIEPLERIDVFQKALVK